MSRYVIEDREKMQFSVSREALVSPAVLEQEQQAIFEKCWIYVGHSSEIGAPGEFKTRDVAGRPIIFCRDRQGVARCFLNTCRHRGTIVCTEREGSTRYFTCPYHGWTYDTDGALRNVPGEDAYGPHFLKERFGLVPPPRFDSYRDFHFLSLDPEAPDLADYLGNARDSIDLVIDQSPSGRLEIVAGVQEYDIRANWKLLVENSVDDYHLPSTHSTWLNYMRAAGVTTRPPRDSGLLLPTKGAGKDLGNGHLTTDNPNFRGRPVAAWISIYGEAAKDDIAGLRRELVERLGEARAQRVADTNRNLVVFPNLVVNDGSSVTVRTFFPTAPGHMHVTAWALGPVEETPEQRARRLDAFLTFYGPGGFATPDDVAALELLQRGLANWREVGWSDLSRGMNKAPTDQLDTDEGHLRVFWRRWSELMEARR